MTNEREQALLHVIDHGGRVSQTMYHDMQARAEAAEKRVAELEAQLSDAWKAISTRTDEVNAKIDQIMGAKLATAEALLREALLSRGDTMNLGWIWYDSVDDFLSEGK